MFGVPQEVLVVLCAFAPLFSKPVWNHARILVIGAILSTGKRTVTSSALRVMGLRDEERFTNFHGVLNRAKWNTLQGAKILLGLLISLVPASLPLIILVNETIERRKGKKIKAKGCYRDSVRSTQKMDASLYDFPPPVTLEVMVTSPRARRTDPLRPPMP
jgi:hypothetical protein